MTNITSGGFTQRASQTDQFVQAVEANILRSENYFRINTGIEHRFATDAPQVHRLLYNSLGTTTDILRYFPDSLYFDRQRRWPTWETTWAAPERLPAIADENTDSLFSFFVEYKYSSSERRAPLIGVPTPFIAIVEREAWLTYQRLTRPNPDLGIYLDGQRTRIALFYAATYAPDKLYAEWEHNIEPILSDPRAINTAIARPNQRAVGYSTGSGTPWINIDLRTLKPLNRFLTEDLFWDPDNAQAAFIACRNQLFPSGRR
jgi:hypothetical protein